MNAKLIAAKNAVVAHKTEILAVTVAASIVVVSSILPKPSVQQQIEADYNISGLFP